MYTEHIHDSTEAVKTESYHFHCFSLSSVNKNERT